jgi:retron-type reverse transcriptase
MKLQSYSEEFVTETQSKISIRFDSKSSKLSEIDVGVRQGRPLSPTLCNIYLHEIIMKWQKEDIIEIPLSKNKELLTLLFADDQVLTSNTEDNVQKAAHELNQITTEYGSSTSVEKTKSMAFKGRDPVRTKTAMDNKIIRKFDIL